MTYLGAAELDPAHDVVDFLAVKDQPDLTTCDREPIHLSGAIQPHGVLIAVEEHGMRVRHISANYTEHTGASASDLIGRTLVDAVGIEVADRVQFALENSQASGSEPLMCHLPHVGAYDLTWHRIDGLVVIELEPTAPDRQTSMSALFADVRLEMQELEEAAGLAELCDIAARGIKRLTGYDRVMMYRFHPDQHGEVVAEAAEPNLEPFLGLHYPASDIPRQARKLYLLNRIRVVVDVSYTPVSLISAAGSPAMNLSLSALRSVSPIHLEYLSNMGVQATMTISIMHGNRLWGMLACHHSRAKRLDPQLRAACRILGQVLSMQIVAQERQESYAYRATLGQIEIGLMGRLADASSLADALVAANPSPLALTAADGLVARIDGETVRWGDAPAAPVIAALLEHARGQDDIAMIICDDAPHSLPDFSGFAALASGVLGVSLSGIFDDFIFWFRGEFIQHVRWAGEADKISASAQADNLPTSGAAAPSQFTGFAPSAVLSPRRSFAEWSQEIRGHSLPWLDAEVDAAREFASVIPKLLLARARDRLAHLAIHDELTGLPNRTLLLDRTGLALARQKRTSDEVVLLFIDLDRFKFVNDSLGHAAGDDLLRQAAGRLTGVVRDSDTVARLGGDEFVVLCENSTVSGARQLAERVVLAFRPPFALGQDEATVTASVGIAVAEAGATPAELLRDADTAMYRTKHSGRDNFAPFTSEMRAISVRRVEIEATLRAALHRRELSLYFQPVHTCAGVLTGFEALARWPLPGRGMVSPLEFIPVAEAINLMAPLTEWVVDEGFKSLAQWRDARPELDLTLAVNITAGEIMNTDLERTIFDNLERYNLPPRALCLELTESALVSDDPSSIRFFRNMRGKGIRLSIDDFGTGFSSLAYLTKLPVHELKIDRAFITGLPTNQADVAVVASVVALAHQLGLDALAEGVENDDQLATVRRLGCDRVQGYLLGRPMPADEITRFLGNSSDLASA